MALGRKKSGGRKEPLFGLAASLSDLRLGPQDRVPNSPSKPKKSSAKSKTDDSGDGPAAERKSRTSRGGAKRRSKSGIGASISRLFYWGAVAGLWGMIAVVGVVIYVGAHLPSIQSLEIPKRPPTIQIVGFDGSVLASRGEMAGANVALKDLPPYLPKAFIAIEDRRFYSHFGIDPWGILRAAVTNVLHRGVSQGGSTLTQQLAKNLFLTQERTLQRKLQEAELALWLERKHSKAEILELYLNRVYFGSGAYGVEAAAQRYFGKSAKNVTIAEAAMLAGLVKSPSRLAPNRNPEGAEKRAQTVLAAMADSGFITEAQAQASIGHPSYNVKPAGAGTINYVADWIGEVLDDLVGQVEQDIVVETSIDPKLQSIAEASVIDELAAKSVKFNVSQGALVAMTPDGAVRAMVGGRNYAESQYNRAVTAKRQPGSSFKPFVYLTAIEAGLTPDTIRQDAPLNVKGWKPENYEHQYLGSVTLTQALSMSLNTVAVRLGLEVGPSNVVRTAHRLGISLEARSQCLDRARHVRGLADRTGGGLCAVRQWRPGHQPACRAQDPHQCRQDPVCACARSTGSGDRTAQRRHDEHHDAGNPDQRHRPQGGVAGMDGRRQDRHQPGFPRCLVHRLHLQPCDRRVARQRRQLTNQKSHRRRIAGRDLVALHARGASGRVGYTAAELSGPRLLRRRCTGCIAVRRLATGPASHGLADHRALSGISFACTTAAWRRLSAGPNANLDLGATGSRRRTGWLADAAVVRREMSGSGWM